MPSHHNNQKPAEHPNERALEGNAKAGSLPVSDLDEATQARLEQEALDAGTTHPNRNYDKPDLDKPAYS